ncbi:MAG: hypothetical protein LH631_03080 [Alkalinema sp. CAN_BIN05]|nr:hypothetical protein [Alkalinema sp. CAN_BIN05]
MNRSIAATTVEIVNRSLLPHNGYLDDRYTSLSKVLRIQLQADRFIF